MIQLDSFTLNLTSVFLSAIMAVTMFAMYLANKQELCLLDWAGAGLFKALGFGFSSLLNFLAETHILYPITLGLTNTFYLLAYCAILRGLLRHFSYQLFTKEMLLLALIFALVHYLPVINSSFENRIVLFFIVTLVVNLSSIYLLVHGILRTKQWSYLPLLLMCSFYVFQLLVRTIITVFSEIPIAIADINHPIHTVGWLFDVVFVSVATLSCVLIIIRKQVLEIRNLSITDQLTSTLNRRALEEVVPKQFNNSQRLKEPLTLIIFDIDFFKKINDNYGHDIGDLALKHVSSLVKNCIRETDQLFRVGGEEFIVLSKGLSCEGSMKLAEKIRQTIEKSLLEIDDKQLAITVSVGIALVDEYDSNWQDTLKKADKALYLAKNNGRNKTLLANDCVFA